MTESDMQVYYDAFLMKLELIIKGSEKETYTKQELIDFLDSLSISKKLLK